jgi:hypothetical protein
MAEKSRSALIALSKMGAITWAVPSMLADSSIDDNGIMVWRMMVWRKVICFPFRMTDLISPD